MPNLLRKSGDVVGRLTLIRHIPNRGWLVRCSCGNKACKIVSGGNLDKTHSCGCLRREVTGNRFRTHGEFGSTEYSSWIALKQRCEERKSYADVVICSRWVNSFDNFLEDMGRKPLGDDMVIERIDPSGGYNPNNCLWIPRKENKPDSRNGVPTIWGRAKSEEKYKALMVQLRDTQRIPICQTPPDKIKSLSPLDRFLYWVSQRHEIWLKRSLGFSKPWTTDPILQGFFFTSPYRENDKTTQWFRKNVRDPIRNDPRVLMATVIFRWFNYIPSGEALRGYFEEGRPRKTNLLLEWNAEQCIRMFHWIGGKVFTGAFMINSPAGEPKLEAICRRIDNVWEDRANLLGDFHWRRGAVGVVKKDLTMEAAHKRLTQYDGLGGFMAYEIVCDLRYTYLLENAPDKMTWCNPGPGAVRGICRLLGIDFEKGRNAHGFTPSVDIDIQDEIRKVLSTVQRRLPKMPAFEMREVEHSLCEFDKYERALWGDGRMKRLFKGV